MNSIKTVTIFESWVQVAETLNNEQKGEFYHAIMRYALYGEEPELTPPLDAFFSLVRPVIDKSNNRKIAGSKGGKNKQNSSKTQAKFKQNASKIQANDEANFKQAFKQTIKQNASEEEEEEEEEEEVKGESIIAPACEKIVKNFPKEGIRDFRKAVYAAINAVRYQLDLPGATVESAIEVVESGVINYANAVNGWSFEEKRFIKDAEKFFNESHYLTDPVKWQSRKENDAHKKQTGYDWRNPETWGEE